MDYYCSVCDKFIKPKSKYNHFASNNHNELDKCKHILLSLKNIDINDVNEAFYIYIIESNKRIDHYLLNWQFILVFNVYQYCPYVTSKLSDKKKQCIRGRIC